MLIDRYYKISSKAARGFKSILYFTLPRAGRLSRNRPAGNCRRGGLHFSRLYKRSRYYSGVSDVLRINHVSRAVKRNCNLLTTSITARARKGVRARARAILSHYTNISSSSGKELLHPSRLFPPAFIGTQFLADITFPPPITVTARERERRYTARRIGNRSVRPPRKLDSRSSTAPDYTNNAFNSRANFVALVRVEYTRFV